MDAQAAYRAGTDRQFEAKPFTLGPWSSYSMRTDPKHILFTLARYKFAAKLLEGQRSVIDVGPGDGIGLPILAQHVGGVYAVDWDDRLTMANAARYRVFETIEHLTCDLNVSDCAVTATSAVMIDVIEHLESENEHGFLSRVMKCLPPDGVLFIGTPNVTAADYASAQSREQHINLHDHKSLRALVERFCRNVFMFGQNDEVVHTGYAPMCHYLWALGVGKR